MCEQHPTNPDWCRCVDPRGRFIGQALCSPRSEIRLRLLERTDRPVDAAWWRERLAAAARRRDGIDATAYRVVHGEGDGASLARGGPIRPLGRRAAPLRRAGDDARSRSSTRWPTCSGPRGSCSGTTSPSAGGRDCRTRSRAGRGDGAARIEVREGGVRYLAAPWTGQKTGAFLDQRPNRLLAGALTGAGGRALDCFAYHGSFALHLAGRAGTRRGARRRAPARSARARANAALNGFDNIEWRAADAFEGLRAMARAREQFDTVVLDPPAFAKTRASAPGPARLSRDQSSGDALPRARRHPAHGVLLLPRPAPRVSHDARRGRRRQRPPHPGRRILGQGEDHPEVLTIPETGYLKGALLEAE